jgi:nitroreductase
MASKGLCDDSIVPSGIPILVFVSPSGHRFFRARWNRGAGKRPEVSGKELNLQIMRKSKPAPTRYPIHDLMRERWSPRAFALSSVSQEELLTILEAARWAPSCFNEQPWRFLVGIHPHPVWQTIFQTLDAFNRQWCERADVLVAVCAKKTFSHNGKENFHAGYDCGQAAMSMVLQAEALGWICHQMAGFSRQKTQELFELGDDLHPMTVVALGKPGTDDLLPDDLRASENKPRVRRPLSELTLKTDFQTVF